jgi:RNAse (barnase) inhibitor barstar
MSTFTIDCSQIRDEAAFWHAYLAATNPEGAANFGRNLDAFWDALHGGPGWPGECNLHFTNTATIRRFRDGRFYDALQDMARDSRSVGVKLD